MASANGTSDRGRGRILLGENVFHACLEQLHLHSAATRIQGALFGNVTDDSASWNADLAIWSLQMGRSQDGHTQTEEGLVAAQQEAQAMSHQVVRPTKVVGWYTSGLSGPTDDDVKLQVEYQENFADFCVGLVFASRTLPDSSARLTVDAFRVSESRGCLARVPVQVEVVPLCSLVTEDCLLLQPSCQPTLLAMRQVLLSMQEAREVGKVASKTHLAAQLQVLCNQYEGLCLMLESEVPSLGTLVNDLKHNSQALADVVAQAPEEAAARRPQEQMTSTPVRPAGSLSTKSDAPSSPAEASSKAGFAKMLGNTGAAPRVSGPAVSAEAEMIVGNEAEAQQVTTPPLIPKTGTFLDKLTSSRTTAKLQPAGAVPATSCNSGSSGTTRAVKERCAATVRRGLEDDTCLLKPCPGSRYCYRHKKYEALRAAKAADDPDCSVLPSPAPSPDTGEVATATNMTNVPSSMHAELDDKPDEKPLLKRRRHI